MEIFLYRWGYFFDISTIFDIEIKKVELATELLTDAGYRQALGVERRCEHVALAEGCEHDANDEQGAGAAGAQDYG